LAAIAAIIALSSSVKAAAHITKAARKSIGHIV
jgi:hypothetical protein